MKKIAILQSNYIPWKGYFDLINMVDEFVIYDDMQYTKRDWRNRNKIKTPQGLKWLTVPVEVKGKYHQKINETKIVDKGWNLKHLNILKQKGAELSICTNKPGYLARPLIKDLSLSKFFIRIVGSDDLIRNKPYPDHIWTAAGHRGTKKKIIMVGDSLPDVISAHKARVPSIVMQYGYSTIPARRLGGDYILQHFKELPLVINKLIY